jgi:hypothetical protein
MDSQQPRKTSTAFEYFLYAAILAETGLAALIYKFIFRNPEMARMRVYFAIFYFAFLAWAIAQLNMLHRDRTPGARQAPEREAEPVQSTVAAEVQSTVSAEDARSPLGLTAAQLAIVVLVFATAVAAFSWALRLLF